jgi:DNA-binding MarR family transcriptional regulator
MSSLQEYFTKSPRELRGLLSQIENGESFFDSAELKEERSREQRRIKYVIMTKEGDHSLKQVKQRYEKLLEEEIREMNLASVPMQSQEREITQTKIAEVPKKSQGGQFVKIMFDVLENIDWLKKNRNKTALYLVMRRFICRHPMANDKFDIYNRYYKANRLACCLSEDHLAHLFGYNTRSQVQRMLKKLEREGAFIVETIPQRKPLKPKKIYILGEFQAGAEVYYYK